MKTVMVNFRAGQDLLDEIDHAADISGQNRSEFIRSKMEEFVRTVRPADVPTVTPCVDGKHPADSIVMMKWGVKLCQACGKKLR